ncbi:MAG: acyl-CoA dehydrogenase [Chloroflexi bacterium]|nr:MAG: acyl-CoA dehydrogenase [Chloroflexota bacterium]
MDFSIPAEWTDLLRTVREFTEQEIEPIWRKIEDDDEIPAAVLAKAGALGLFGLTIPEEYGGLGLPMLAKALVYEELGRTHAGFVSIIGTHCGIGTTAITNLGSEEQKRAYLPMLATGEWIGAFALTEPGAGSDAASIATSATRRGDRWILNGTKHFITNARMAEVFTVFAVTDRTKGSKGISAFIVPRDANGFTISRFQPTMGLRGSHVAELVFENCEIPAENLLGPEGLGYTTALKTLAQGRVGIGARCVGAAQRCIELSVDYARQRKQFGKPIAEFQLIQGHLAEMAAETAAARQLAYYSASLLDAGKAARREAAMTKLVCTETYGRVVDKAVQIHGGMGYCKDVQVEHYYRDARITRIYEGTSEIQKLIIARDLLGE